MQRLADLRRGPFLASLKDGPEKHPHLVALLLNFALREFGEFVSNLFQAEFPLPMRQSLRGCMNTTAQIFPIGRTQRCDFILKSFNTFADRFPLHGTELSHLKVTPQSCDN